MTTPTEREPGPIAAVTGKVVDCVGAIAEWLVRFVKGIAQIAPVVLGLGSCQSNTVDAPVPPAPMPREMASAPAESQAPPPDAGPQQLGEFDITFYYMIGEEEVARSAAAKAAKAAKLASGKPVPANDNAGSDTELTMTAAAPEMVTLYSTAGSGACDPVAEVTRDFASQIELQGTGKLKDGRVLNIWGHCRCEHSPCFKVTETQWGTAGSGRPLQPFRTVAVDPKVVKLGSLLYVPLLEGRTMPGRAPWGGFVHDGCVVADDTGGGIGGNQLDLFVGRKGYYMGLSGQEGSHAWARHAKVFDGSKICERKGRQVGRKAGAI